MHKGALAVASAALNNNNNNFIFIVMHMYRYSDARWVGWSVTAMYCGEMAAQIELQLDLRVGLGRCYIV